YPFGLTMAGISSRALNNSPNNRYKFNGGNELQSAEFFDGSGLELYDAVNRRYDPQIGRFWQVDELAEANWEWTPYNFAINNPILRNDPFGLKDSIVNGENVNTVPPLATVTLTGYTNQTKKNLYWQLVNSNTDFSRLSNSSLRNWMYNYDGLQRFKDRTHQLQREQEEFVLEVGSLFAPVGWITKIRYLRYAERLFNFKRGRIFWTGGREIAGATAENYARLFGGHTLEMTLKGKYLEIIQKNKGYSAVAPLWEKASKEFAQGAVGEVRVFINSARFRADGLWNSTEKTILEGKNLIIEHKW
ncbi:MAG TPA: RHS repeat-associated core domain-containing protein, partial [Chitinophagaceae bacterium]|nr:RHS repeat-associated core domain-containing protein [Chitinophagaceae bacterium]